MAHQPLDDVFLLDSDDDNGDETIVDTQAYARFNLVEGQDAGDKGFTTVKQRERKKTVRTLVFGFGILIIAIVVIVSIATAGGKKHHSDDKAANSNDNSIVASTIFSTAFASSQPPSVHSSASTSATSTTVSGSPTNGSSSSTSSPNTTTSTVTATSASQVTTVQADECDAVLQHTFANGTRVFTPLQPCATHANASQSYMSRANPVDNAVLNTVLVGDFGRDGLCCQIDVALEMALASDKMDADFIVSTGDNFYPDGLQFVGDVQANTSFSRVYTALQALQKDWYAVLGNHDVRGSVQAQLKMTEQDVHWHMPQRYYSKVMVKNNVTMLWMFLDTTLMMSLANQTLAAEQNEWINATLAASQADWKVVVGHHPVVTAGEHQAELRKDVFSRDNSSAHDVLLPLFEQYKVAVYFCGHDHDLQHLRITNNETNSRYITEFFVTGAGSQIRDPLKYADTTSELQMGIGRQGFMTASVNATHMQVQMLDYVGTLSYTDFIPRPV